MTPIRLIRLPLPFELDHVYAGLVELEDGYMLVDTGMAQTFSVLEAQLAEASVRWSDIRIVLATHIHPDHSGAVPSVVEASGAKFYLHRDEFAYLSDILAGNTPWIQAAFSRGGVPEELWDGIRKSLLAMRAALPKLKPDRLLEGGEEIATKCGIARVIATPGHSPGHVCLYWPDRKTFFAGDHMIEKTTPNIAWSPDRDMLGEYLDSLTTVEQLDIESVVSSHGSAFGNHREWIAATRRHHDERCAGILRCFEDGPHTAHELIPRLWDRDFSSFHYYFALFEILAHIEYMERRGILEPKHAARADLGT